MSYLKHKPGSIEEMMANQAKKLNDSAYQDMFKKELEKAGKGIGAMSPKEKKDFFNKIDDKYKAKNEDTKEEVSQKDVDKFHTKLDKLVHKSFGHSSDEKKKEVKEEDAYDKDDEKPKSKPKKEAVDNPYAVGMAAAMKAKDDKPPLKKSTITKAHDIAKSIKKDEKNEEVKYPHKMYSKDGKEVEAKTPEDHKKYADMGYTHKNETHTFMTKDMNKSKKDAKGEKEIVDPEPKLKQESMLDAVKNVWQLSAEQLEKIKSEAKYMKAQRMDKYKGKADTGSDETKVELEPSVDYKN